MTALKEIKHEHFMLAEDDRGNMNIKAAVLDHLTSQLSLNGESYSVGEDGQGNHQILLDGAPSNIDVALSKDYGLAGFAYLLAEEADT